MFEIDGSRYSGSGTIVRQAIAFAALTGNAVHIVNVRLRRPKPGLRHQHVRVVEAIRDLAGGTAEGVTQGFAGNCFSARQGRQGPGLYVGYRIRGLDHSAGAVHLTTSLAPHRYPPSGWGLKLGPV